MTQKTIGAMRLVGGHPCLDFVNTVDARRGRWGPDLLESYSDLIIWGRRAQLIDQTTADRLSAAALQNPKPADDALDHAVSTREAIYDVLKAEAAGTAPSKDAQELLRSSVDEALRQRTITWTSAGWRWDWLENRGLETIVDRIAYEAAGFLSQAHLRRPVRECFGNNCGWLFLDTSRGGQRRWCCDETCGSHSRVRRFRRRAKDP
jgi:predicted RNA-binding Zn ribbon-like protein